MKKIILLFTAMVCFLTIEAQTITKFEGKRNTQREYINLASGVIRFPNAVQFISLQLDFRFEFTNGNTALEIGDTILIRGHIGNQDFFNGTDTIVLQKPLAANDTLSMLFPGETMGYYTNVFQKVDDSIYRGTIYGKIEYISRYVTKDIPTERSTEITLIQEQPSTPPEPPAVIETVMEKVKLYPNPVSSNLHITNLKNTNIEVYNVVGQRVSHFEDVSGDFSICMKIFPDGIYFVKLQNGKAVRTEKIKLVK